MLQVLTEWVYNCCFGLEKKRKNTKIHDAMYVLENLSRDDFNKLMRIYNIKCC